MVDNKLFIIRVMLPFSFLPDLLFRNGNSFNDEIIQNPHYQ